MPAGLFARHMFARFAPWWLWPAVALALIATVVGAFTDVRWCVVGLMILLVVLPPALAFTYYYYALNRECFINTVPHSVCHDGSRLIVRLYVRNESDRSQPEGEGNAGPDSLAEPEEPDFKFLRDEVFGPEAVTGMAYDGRQMVISLKDRHRGFLWVANNVFEKSDYFDKFASWVRTHKG